MEDYNNKPPFSETSLDFTKSTAKISLKSGSSWVFGYDDFTIESWVYCRDLEEFGNYLNDKTIFGSMTASRYKQQFLFYIRYNGKLAFWNGKNAVGGGKLSNHTWHHVALVRRNLRIYMYLDGKLVYNGCEVSNFRQNSGFSVGSVYDPFVKQSDKWTRPFDGYMQDIRVVKNSALYTCNFKPSKKLLSVCPVKERCEVNESKCLVYINYEFNNPWYMGNAFKTNTHTLRVEKDQPVSEISHIFMTTQSRYYSPGTNTATIRNVKMRASTDSEWVDVDVDLSTRSEEIYEKNPKYTAIAFNIKIPSVDSDCNMEFTPAAPCYVYLQFRSVTKWESSTMTRTRAIRLDEFNTTGWIDYRFFSTSDTNGKVAWAKYRLENEEAFTDIDLDLSSRKVGSPTRSKNTGKIVYPITYRLYFSKIQNDCDIKIFGKTIDCPTISWEILDANTGWKKYEYYAEDLVEDVDGKKCITEWTSANLCADANYASANFDLNNESHFKNLKYTDCNGEVTSADTIEFDIIDGQCGSDSNAKVVRFKGCFNLQNEPCKLYVKYDFNTKWGGKAGHLNNRTIIDGYPTKIPNHAHTSVEKMIDGKYRFVALTTKDINGTASNFRISTSSSGPWKSVSVNSASRQVHPRPQNNDYYPISYEIPVDYIDASCNFCTPKISWQVNDANGNWIERNYDASLYLDETEPGKFCTKNEDGFVEASLCINKSNSNATSTWGLTSSDVRNFTYTDCFGNVTSASNVELTRRTGTCASETDSWRVWFKTCFDTTTPTPVPTPTQTPIGQQDPTPTPTPFTLPDGEWGYKVKRLSDGREEQVTHNPSVQPTPRIGDYVTTEWDTNHDQCWQIIGYATGSNPYSTFEVGYCDPSQFPTSTPTPIA